MTYDECLAKAEGLKARFNRSFTTSDKADIVQMYSEVLGKTFRPTTCQQCYHDALIEIYLCLKKNRSMKKSCRYKLRAGFIISCPTFREGQIFSNANLTDEVAEEYLALFPKRADMFEKTVSAVSAPSKDKEGVSSKPAVRKRSTRKKREK